MLIQKFLLACILFFCTVQVTEKRVSAERYVAVRCHTFQTPSPQFAEWKKNVWIGLGYQHTGVLQSSDGISVVVGVEIFTLEQGYEIETPEGETSIICG